MPVGRKSKRERETTYSHSRAIESGCIRRAKDRVCERETKRVVDYLCFFYLTGVILAEFTRLPYRLLGVRRRIGGVFAFSERLTLLLPFIHGDALCRACKVSLFCLYIVAAKTNEGRSIDSLFCLQIAILLDKAIALHDFVRIKY